MTAPRTSAGAALLHAGEVDASASEIRIVDPESCDLLLMASNQSYLDDPVVLSVVIDGVEVLSQPFEVVNQHHVINFPLRLAPGMHRLKVASDTGVILEREFTMPEGGPRQHAAISYYNYADEDGKLIDWHIQPAPMGIK